jgi:Ran GTPase-activating protein (RanGAP) involved in mRNA processing and transport
MLSNKFKLSKLNLNNNPIGDEGFVKIAEGLNDIETLRIITMANTQVTKSGIPALAASLQNKRFLTKILLDNNAIGPEGA